MKILITSIFLLLSIFEKVQSQDDLTPVSAIVPEEEGRAFLASKLGSPVRGRIVYGTRAQNGQFPYLAYSVIFLNNRRQSLCGSSLITSTWVLTAAHCLQNLYAAQFYFGSVDKTAFTTMRNGIAYVNHQRFNNPPLANDVGLFLLQSGVSFTPVKLPTRSFNSWNPQATTLIAVGFGQDENGNLPRYLYYTDLKGQSFAQCQSILGKNFFVDQMMCAKGDYGNSVCFGDSGGPLLFGSTIVGINGFGTTANCINSYNGFARVDRFLDWIAKYTGQRILN